MKVASLPEDPGVPDRVSHYFRGPREGQRRRLDLRFRTRQSVQYMPWLCTAAGQPDRIINAPSAFREGDSATRSRVEKLPETTNQPKQKNEELEGAKASSPTPRCRDAWPPRSGPAPTPIPGFPPHTPGIQRGQGEQLCSRSAAVTRCGDASRGGRRGLCGGARLSAARSLVYPVPPLPTDLGSRSAIGIKPTQGGDYSPRDFELGGGLAAQTVRNTLFCSPAVWKRVSIKPEKQVISN